MFLNLNLDVRVGDADLDHGMGRRVRCARDGDGFEGLVLFALFAEIVVGTDGAFVTNAADAEFVVLAGGAVAVDVGMYQIDTGNETFQGRGEVGVHFCEGVLRMDGRLTGVAVAAEIIVATFEAFVSDANNVLKLVGKWYWELLVYTRRNELGVSSLFRQGDVH